MNNDKHFKSPWFLHFVVLHNTHSLPSSHHIFRHHHSNTTTLPRPNHRLLRQRIRIGFFLTKQFNQLRVCWYLVQERTNNLRLGRQQRQPTQKFIICLLKNRPRWKHNTCRPVFKSSDMVFQSNHFQHHSCAAFRFWEFCGSARKRCKS